MAKGLKAFIPLIVGGVVMVAGIIGAVVSSVRPPAPIRPPPPTVAELLELAAEDRVQQRQEKLRLEVEQAKLDKDEVKQIILDQIRGTPEDISDEWFGEVFQYVKSAEAFWAFLDLALVKGRQYDAKYSAAFKARNPRKAQSGGPPYYITKAKEYIFIASPQEKDLLGPPRRSGRPWAGACWTWASTASFWHTKMDGTGSTTTF